MPKSARLKFKLHEPAPELKLDLGTGKGLSRPDGFVGVDLQPYDGVDVVTDLTKRWPWKTSTVDEVNCNYLVHYLSASERVHFANELHRVLKPDARATIHVPHWSSSKAYGDTRVQWPPVSEMWFAMLNQAWRESQNNVDITGYTCNFDHTLGYGLHPLLVTRNQEYQQHAVLYWKEAAQDIIATLVCLK